MPKNILFIGDIMGKPGRKAVAETLPDIRKKNKVDLVIANVENLAHGKGITEKTLSEIFEAGVDFCTSGNHIWSKTEGLAILAHDDTRVLRPANYPVGSPGVGEKVIPLGKNRILVINLQGRVFMKEALDCPFRALDAILAKYEGQDLAGIIVDFHAEATSEKNSFGLYADGRVSAVVGTHTHIPTADNRVLPGGTAYTTDVGMVGIRDSSIGVDVKNIIQAFLTQRGAPFEIPDAGLVVLNSVLIALDETSKKALSIQRIQKEIEVI